MRTQEEKKQAIKKLRNEKESLPEYSFFGDPNHEAIEAQIQTIDENMDEEDIVELWGEEYNDDDEPNYITQNALQALSWLDGDIELSELIEED